MNRPENGTTLDPYGDRSLIVGSGENQKRFLISSHAMRLASPAWKAMLTGPYKEGTANEISFPSDDPDAFLIILKIAHLQFQDLPSELKFQELVNIAAICDKYDTVSIVRPFCKKWIDPLEPWSEEIGFEQWLLVAWTFGLPEIFERITNRLVRHASTNADGQCLNETDKILDEFIMPPGVIESILRIRNSVIADILGLCHRHLDRLKSSTLEYCQARTNRVECGTLTLGSLVRGLEPLGLWPIRPDPSEIFMSVSKLTASLRRIPIYTYPDMPDHVAPLKHIIDQSGRFQPGYYMPRSVLEDLINIVSRNPHAGCNFKEQFSKDIDTIMDNIPSAVLDSHRQHMKTQSAR